MVDDAALLRTIEDGGLAVLATIKRDGLPQLSNVSYCFDGTDLIRVSATDDRAKTINLRRDPRATLLVQGASPWHYTVAEVHAQVLPVAAAPDDASVEELIDIYRTINGEHPDWDDYRRAMVTDRRVPLHLRVHRLYGIAPS